MKVRNYEKKDLLIFLSIIFIILEVVFIIGLYINKMYDYKKVTAIVLKENLLIIVASKEERKLFYNNSFLYLNSKKEKYKISRDSGVIMTKNEEKYYELLIKTKFDKKYKPNDTLTVSLKTKKQRLINIFKVIGGR